MVVQYHGEGMYSSANQAEVYEGQYEMDKRHGHGRCQYGDGSKYTGGWASDQRSGQGTFEFADGSRYEGGWRDGKFEGGGIRQYADGSRCVRGVGGVVLCVVTRE